MRGSIPDLEQFGIEDDRKGSKIEPSILVSLEQWLQEQTLILNPRTIRNYTSSMKKIIPILTAAGLTKTHHLHLENAIQNLLQATGEAVRKKKLGNTASTVDRHLEFMTHVLKLHRVSYSEIGLFKKGLRQVRRSSMLKHSRAEPMTNEQSRLMLFLLDEWAADSSKAPSLWTRKGRTHLMPTQRNIDRLRAFGSVACYFGLRFSEIMTLRLEDLNEKTFTYFRIKGEGYPQQKGPFTMPPSLWVRIKPHYSQMQNKGKKLLFCKGQDAIEQGIKVLMLSAGVPLHNGRVGIHRIRPLIVENAVNAGLDLNDASQALTHATTATTLRSYTSADIKTKMAQRAFDETQAKIESIKKELDIAQNNYELKIGTLKAELAAVALFKKGMRELMVADDGSFMAFGHEPYEAAFYTPDPDIDPIEVELTHTIPNQEAIDEQVKKSEKTLAKTGKNDELKCESRELNSGSGVGNAR